LQFSHTGKLRERATRRLYFKTKPSEEGPTAQAKERAGQKTEGKEKAKRRFLPPTVKKTDAKKGWGGREIFQK